MNDKKHLITFFSDGAPIDYMVYSCDSKLLFHDDDGYIVKKTVSCERVRDISMFIHYTTVNGTHDFKTGVLFFEDSEHIIQKYTTHVSKQIGMNMYNKIGICYLGMNIFNTKSNGL